MNRISEWADEALLFLPRLRRNRSADLSRQGRGSEILGAFYVLVVNSSTTEIDAALCCFALNRWENAGKQRKTVNCVGAW